jgi:S1-C subfamily serine protease
MKKTWHWVVLTLLLTGAMACRLGLSNGNSPSPQAPAVRVESQITPTVTAILPLITGGSSLNQQDLLVAIYQRVSPGVVLIQVETDQGIGLGSGFVFDNQGHIITNYHVVENATSIEVDFQTGFKVYGKVVGTDLDSDIAVVKVDAPAEELKPLPIGDSKQLKVGQTVVAIGNPFAYAGTMTKGIVSGLGRTLESIRQTPDGNFYTAGDIIQTDAAINPGNSGGPLLNLNGEVVGMNRSIYTTSTAVSGQPTNSGISFAIAGNILKRVVPVLIQTGKFDYPYLGITSISELDLKYKDVLGLPRATGAYITSVVKGSPGEKAGLLAGTQPSSIQGLNKGGDLIIAIDGQPVLVFGDLLSYLMDSKSPGDTVTLTIIRDGQEKEVAITLGKRP